MTRADRPTAIIGANNVIGARCAAGDPRSRLPLPGRRLAGRHRRRAVERTCAAARHDVGAADRRDRTGGDRLPARTDVRWSRGPRPAARPGVPAAFPVRRFMRLAASSPDRRVGLTRRVRQRPWQSLAMTDRRPAAGEDPVSQAERATADELVTATPRSLQRASSVSDETRHSPSLMTSSRETRALPARCAADPSFGV